MTLDDFLSTVILLILLVIFFSVYGKQDEEIISNGNWKVNNSLASGSNYTESSIVDSEILSSEMFIIDENEDNATEEHGLEVNKKEIKEIIIEDSEEELRSVTALIIAFWHGVVAVLIGGGAALLIAYAWTKIRGGK